MELRRWEFLRDDNATALIEMALVSTLLLAMMFGIIQMSFALYSYDFVSDAAREATRYAVVRGSASCSNTPNLTNCDATSAQIQTYLQNLGYPGLTSSNLTATTTWSQASATQPTTWTVCATECNEPGNQVVVVVNYPFALRIPFVPNSTINITSTSTMVISQ